MFTSLKKWVKNEENPQVKQPPARLQTMRSDLQKKFAKGVQYNLKIVIRGDRNSGKTCLWHRLQGHKFVEEYVPTPEIQVTSIQWNYKATDDIVKVDVWDVVDKGKPKQQSNTLKLTHAEENDDDECRLDANFLDVYKGAHAVLMVFDITKKWTYQYIEKELPKIPAHIPVLVLANHRDMGSHRVINLDKLQALVESIERPAGSADIFFLESSMKSGFGLKYIHKFFNLPFLLVQRESLLKQLETNHLDVESCLEELHFEPTSDEQSYDHFLRALQEKQNQTKKVKQSPEPTAPSSNGRDTTPPKPTTPQPPVNDTANPPAEPARITSPPTSLNIKAGPENKPNSGGLFSPSMMTSASPTEASQKEPEKKGFMSRFFKGSSAAKQEVRKSSEGDAPVIIPAAPSSGRGPVDIDKFIPDDEGTDNFLNEIPDTAISRRNIDNDMESSSDEDVGNPMVAGFQEELDSDDQMDTSETPKVYSYSDSDDDYQVSPKATRTIPTPVSTRSLPKSRLSPEPHAEDIKLQHLEIDSDSSKENTPYIMPDEDNISDIETSNQKTKTYNYSSADENIHSSMNENTHSLNSKRSKIAAPNEKSAKLNVETRVSVVVTDEASSEDDHGNAMVSTVVEDFGSDQDIPESPKPEKPKNETQKVKFQLETSDLDFLEQISTSTPEVASSYKSSKSKHKSKTKKKHDDEDGTKKHKHKKKKSKSRDADSSTEVKSSKKKSSKKKTAEENALEEFLAGGDDSY